MKTFAVIDGNTVVGLIAAEHQPSLNIPSGRRFVDVTQGPSLRGGEQHDRESGVFMLANVQPSSAFWPEVDALATRITAIEKKISKL